MYIKPCARGIVLEDTMYNKPCARGIVLEDTSITDKQLCRQCREDLSTKLKHRIKQFESIAHCGWQNAEASEQGRAVRAEQRFAQRTGLSWA